MFAITAQKRSRSTKLNKICNGNCFFTNGFKATKLKFAAFCPYFERIMNAAFWEERVHVHDFQNHCDLRPRSERERVQVCNSSTSIWLLECKK
jgi:hypothetical protein